MGILSQAELSIYAPKVYDHYSSQGNDFEGGLSVVTALVESETGANRPLELQQITEDHVTQCVTGEFEIFLEQLPVVRDETHLMEVKLRPRYMRGSASIENPYRSVNSFWLDTDGRLTFSSQKYDGFNRQSTAIVEFLAQIIYWTGFDFTQNTPKTKKLKAATGRLWDWLLSNQYLGIEEVDIPMHKSKIKYKIEQPGVIPASYFAPFREYRPAPALAFL